MSGEAPTFTFSSLDAHNGCRALFNGTKGWAFIAPSGAIDTKAFPDTLPLAVPERRYGKACRKAAAAAASSAVKRDESARRPGDKIIRKMNEIRRIRSACLDTKDVERLIHEAKRSTSPHSEAGNADEEDWGTEGGRREGERRIRRAGQPIVLTLQAIMAATSKSPKSDATAASALSTTGLSEDRDQCSSSEAMPSEKEGLEGEGGLNLGGRVGDQGVPQVADPAHFPPLMLHGASSEENGLYLSPPIIMVKRPSSPEKGEETGEDGVSCSEAVEATRIAEPVQAMSGGAEVPRAVGVMSRVGWWLRWTRSAGGGGALADPMEYSVATEDQGHIDCFEASKAFGEGGWEVLPSRTERAETSETDCSIAGKTPTAGGAWALVVTEKCEARGCGSSDAEVALGSYGKGDDDAESWCDCSSDVGEDVVLNSPPLPTVSLSDSPEEHALKERCGPLSYRDMLMLPSPAGVTPFSKSPRLGMRDQGTGFNSSPGPAVVDSGSQGSVVFGWREAETGRGGNGGDWGSCGEVEDPYCARKRLGAFAHRTKPRGREHK